ncbi:MULTISPECIES: WYL domain-containing protein [unclassified Colwellia]|uniref:WYL domain-containing protein n=1 Tax=unclassified Colwellia TaxID=196834 RepID=UPI0015F5DD2E|nr:MULTISPECIES: WYL domain-containing protein [unclassified Colwellia]MBA6232181.1 WYL domain-containing protein [Colwellia sp. MB02u-7]MBA6237121.1 WYL domain-containing protein [Colwellia sp. MB02u-11]MBA6301615.1 WYL domain-containing protein [Colwellia sp. MB3u-22]MBA6311501.1 WYL domain-containing protein [Colwellia sp. MB3u-64]
MIKTQQIIDCYLFFKGNFLRKELCNTLSISPASATREIKRYRDLYPENITYDVSNKCYISSREFSPKFEHDTNFALSLLFENRLIVNISTNQFTSLNGLPVQLPDQKIAAHISRACFLKQNVLTTYLSASSNNVFRTIAPTEIFRVGDKWYVRAFSKESGISGEFRTFKFVRFLNVKIAALSEAIHVDKEWQNEINITLCPHSKHPQLDSLKLDLGLKDKPAINIMTNEVLAGHILQDIRVDCSIEATLNPLLYQYQLMNRHEIKNISSMILAPGFDK